MKRTIFFTLIFLINTVTYAQKVLEPKFIGANFTFRSGEEVTGKVSLDDKFIYLNLETANAKGEKVVLKMDDIEKGDYIYKNKFLAKGSSVKFLVKKDIEKIKLIIYNKNKKKHVKLKLKQESKTSKENVKDKE